MGGIAAIAREAGHKVTGCDVGVYPPMSTQLRAQGIELTEGFSPDQTRLNPDLFVIGNVVTRGNPLMEAILNLNLPYVSGPQWLAETVLETNGYWQWPAPMERRQQRPCSLGYSIPGMSPGFLIGGIPLNFGLSARLGGSGFFVIEADEYDTAFFDKRSKFVHFLSRTAILNNLEFDHADIFDSLAAIERQFHYFVRTIPGNGLIIANGRRKAYSGCWLQGCWTPVELVGVANGWGGNALPDGISINFQGDCQGLLQWSLLGEHNLMNGLAALAAARHSGVPINIGIEALRQFKNVKRRMEVRGVWNGITLYDDFAHHPTAIRTTLDGLRSKVKGAQSLLCWNRVQTR